MRQSWVSTTLVKDNAARFWPLWLAFLGAWVLGLLLPLAVLAPQAPASGSEQLFASAWAAEHVASLLGTAVASVISVSLVFEYLFSPTSAQFHGSLPLKRGALFASSYLGGLLPLVVVELVVAVVLVVMTALMPQIGMENVLSWLGLTLAFTFVSYNMACLCAQLTGSKAMASWLFILGNLLIVTVEEILRVMAETMLVGTTLMTGVPATLWTSPLGGLFYYVINPEVSLNNGVLLDTQSALILAAYLLAAAAFLAAALLLNKRRSLEQAGNTAAYTGVRVVFKYVIGACAAVAVGFIALFCMLVDGGQYISNAQAGIMTVFMVLGGFAGVFFAELALNKSTRVIGKTWRGGLAVAVLCVAFTGCCTFDVFNIRGFVPQASQVKQVAVEFNNINGDVILSSDESIAELTRIHSELLELPDEALNGASTIDGVVGYSYIVFTYTLEDGRVVSRNYELCYPEGGSPALTESQEILNELGELLSTTEAKLSMLDQIKQVEPSRLDVVLSTGWSEERGYESEVHVDYSLLDSFWKALEKDLLEHDLGSVSLGSGDGTSVENASPLDISGYKPDGRYVSVYYMVNKKIAPNTCMWFEKNYRVEFS
ncbi:MAG: hypothetical protein ACI36V_03015 [Coriobacteriales bacterium]